MNFEFATATRIIFGGGTVEQVGPLAIQAGSRAFVVTGKSPDRVQGLVEQLDRHSLPYCICSIDREPTVDRLSEAVNQARAFRSDLVIALGGGSAIDSAKAIAAMLTNQGDLLDYLEVVGKGNPIQNRPVPFIAIPTTAGTGAEVTRNAVLTVAEQQRKVSMRHAMMLPAIAIIDPILTHSLPASTTASTGLDALTQVIEPFVSHLANPVTDTFCRQGITLAARSLEKAYENGQDAQAREDMALASLFGGLALANAKLGAVHGFAGPLGGEIQAPHGAVCGRLLPYVVQVNYRALQERQPTSPILSRFDELGRLLTGQVHSTATDAIDFLFSLCNKLHTNPLSDFGLIPAAIGAIAEKANNSSSMKGNPIELTTQECHSILEMAL